MQNYLVKQKITGDKSLTIEMTDFLSSPKDEDIGLWLKTIQCLFLYAQHNIKVKKKKKKNLKMQYTDPHLIHTVGTAGMQ